MIARHVGQHGYVCPGDGPEHPAHPTRDLTLDHVTALIDGGAPFDPANTRVLCRSRNSANGARIVNARRADRGPHTRVLRSPKSAPPNRVHAAEFRKNWEVLVVGYVSRFARDLRTAVNARHDLHARGAVILFADERVLSSDEDEWERWAREAVEAEAYSRRLAKRIREGYAAKRRRLGVPGGNRAPLGTVRDGRTIAVDEEGLALVRRAYELAAGGRTDREVGLVTGLAPTHVAEVLTNPFYAGRLRTGEPSALGPLVDPATWEHVQVMRARYSRRHRGSVTRRQYGLAGLLTCASCGRRLTGHVGRYRHLDACEPFKAAAPRRHRRNAKTNLDHRVKGESYKAEVYEEAIGRAFEHVAASPTLKANTVAAATRREPDVGDVLAQARIRRERDQAALRFAKDRDLGRLEATMARLDAEAAAAVVRPSRTPTAAEAREYLEHLPELWAKTSDAGRHAIAEAVFERIDVLGVTDYTFTLTAHAKAHGWDAAFGAGDQSISIGRSGRGERSQTSGTDLFVPVTWGLPCRVTGPAALSGAAG